MEQKQSHINSDFPDKWVTLSQVSSILGVNGSTVRRWADIGKLRVFRTPGGHRRFAERDVLALIDNSENVDQLANEAVSRIRHELAQTSGEPIWYRDLSTEKRSKLRPLGHRLAEIVNDYITGRGDRKSLDQEVDEIGMRYGLELRKLEITLLQAIQAVVFFRRSLDETARHLVVKNRLQELDAELARKEIAELADRVLLSVAASYDR
ncbi:MAG: hypothetical protein CL752_06980 [Chloroflexi bacterium]|nr:hypothetical protein [Chloroflexota bacterium]|tara:strand:- start:4383 stop:5006 length:624 start_codon:yes stop_codon:yes gene_type:complete